MPHPDPDDERELAEASGACAYCGQPLLDPLPETELASE
jgi:hypothetical protein